MKTKDYHFILKGTGSHYIAYGFTNIKDALKSLHFKKSNISRYWIELSNN